MKIQTLLLASLFAMAAAHAEEINEMKPVTVITGMTSVTAGNGTTEVYNYQVELVGRALIPRGWGVCDFLQNTLIGHQEIDLVKADGSITKGSIPIVQKNIETGMCDALKKKHF